MKLSRSFSHPLRCHSRGLPVLGPTPRPVRHVRATAAESGPTNAGGGTLRLGRGRAEAALGASDAAASQGFGRPLKLGAGCLWLLVLVAV